MIKIGETIIEEGILNNKPNRFRKTVRGIILKEAKVYMLYSKKFNDYTFPGGGIKEDEDHKEALKRELNEEFGASNINIIKPIGYTEEIRYGINSTNNTYLQTSYYYLVEADKFVEPNYIGREKEQGLSKKLVEINDAIKHNELVYETRDENSWKGFKTVLLRENSVLKYIGDNYEKIRSYK